MRLSHAKRRDANEPEIVAALERIGCSVIRLDVFDILVGFRGRDYKVEIKTDVGTKTPSQIRLGNTWRGSELHIVRSVDEAISLVTQQKN